MSWLRGKRALVTAGPTYEPIDPVRFIGNHATGRMGVAVAEALHEAGCATTLIAGPSGLATPAGADRIDVQTAAEMARAVLSRWPDHDLLVMAAAVADYTIEHPADQKIKKGDGPMTLTLVRTTDILAEAGRTRRTDQVLVGFALETEHGVDNARGKLERKNADIIALNMQSEAGSGFGTDTNRLTLVERGNKLTTFELMTKRAAARALVAHIDRHALDRSLPSSPADPPGPAGPGAAL